MKFSSNQNYFNSAEFITLPIYHKGLYMILQCLMDMTGTVVIKKAEFALRGANLATLAEDLELLKENGFIEIAPDNNRLLVLNKADMQYSCKSLNPEYKNHKPYFDMAANNNLYLSVDFKTASFTFSKKTPIKPELRFKNERSVETELHLVELSYSNDHSNTVSNTDLQCKTVLDKIRLDKNRKEEKRECEGEEKQAAPETKKPEPAKPLYREINPTPDEQRKSLDIEFEIKQIRLGINSLEEKKREKAQKRIEKLLTILKSRPTCIMAGSKEISDIGRFLAFDAPGFWEQQKMNISRNNLDLKKVIDTFNARNNGESFGSPEEVKSMFAKHVSYQIKDQRSFVS